jgi:hypothetical protein
MEDAQELQNIIFTGSQGIFATVQQDIRRYMQLGFMERWPCSEALAIIGKCSRADTTESAFVTGDLREPKGVCHGVTDNGIR